MMPSDRLITATSATFLLPQNTFSSHDHLTTFSTRHPSSRAGVPKTQYYSIPKAFTSTENSMGWNMCKYTG